MSLPPSRLAGVQSVLQFDTPVGRDPARDELLVQGVKTQFPNIVLRQYLPPDVPPTTPHLVLTSTSSQLAISAVAAQFQVRFYGDYLDDVERGLEYVEEKLSVTLAGLQEAGLEPVSVGIVASMQFPYPEGGENPAEYVLATHLRGAVDPEHVHDAIARVAVRVRDTYFVTLTVGNYETRVMERPLFPGPSMMTIRPWEGRIEEVGIELGIDINNNLEARLGNKRVVTEDGIRSVNRLLRDVALSVGPRYAETGDVDVAELTASAAA